MIKKQLTNIEFSDYAKKFLERSRFKTKAEPINLEKDKKSFLGITTISVTPKIIGELRQIHQSIPDEVMQGVLVWKVVNGTLAHESGLEAGDIITHIDGIPVHDASDIYILCSKEKKKVKMDIIHHGKKKRITVKPPR
ncbi:hypothetical protein ILUMI_16688 [Ignelater luminosus]|uniref:PDZ domain-containing protein n=1 Tax=Ignelater luminosus TaxID=2038154 RepID=A0A8K0G2M3_IGNLU|nr:hypothetical protein ILUMI_16688 [Ignelater luminosus]